MTMQKARLWNASNNPPTPDGGISVLFNPTEYSLTRNMSYAEIAVPGLSVPLIQFVRGEAQTLSLELFLDRTSTRESVDGDLRDLRAFAIIDSTLHAPPVCRFQWGDTTFHGVVTQFTEKYTLFREDGAITRARVSLTLKSFIPAKIQLRRPNRNSPDRTQTHVVREGERIDEIAAEAYGDSALWPKIAEANDLERPRMLQPGQVLQIPPL